MNSDNDLIVSGTSCELRSNITARKITINNGGILVSAAFNNNNQEDGDNYDSNNNNYENFKMFWIEATEIEIDEDGWIDGVGVLFCVSFSFYLLLLSLISIIYVYYFILF